MLCLSGLVSKKLKLFWFQLIASSCRCLGSGLIPSGFRDLTDFSLWGHIKLVCITHLGERHGNVLKDERLNTKEHKISNTVQGSWGGGRGGRSFGKLQNQNNDPEKLKVILDSFHYHVELHVISVILTSTVSGRILFQINSSIHST